MNSKTEEQIDENNSTLDQNEHVSITDLNTHFLQLCKKKMNESDFTIFMDSYRKCLQNMRSSHVKETDLNTEDLIIPEEHSYSDLSSVDNSAMTNQMGSDLFDHLPYEDNSEDGGMYENRNYSGMTMSHDTIHKRQEVDFNVDFERHHNAIEDKRGRVEENNDQSQIYKFLIHFYGVNCPLYKKFQIEPEPPVKKAAAYDWPFLDVPTKPRSVFDTGPTREEVGEYNRRIFDLITQNTFQLPQKIIYKCNPNFFDDESDELLRNHKQIFKIDVEIYTYNGDVFVYNDRVTLRIYNLNDQKWISIKNKKRNINMNSEIGDFKFVTEENVKFIDVLYLQNFVIYRLVFRDRYQLESVMRLVMY